jgi:hypothetical protein
MHSSSTARAAAATRVHRVRWAGEQPPSAVA